jgi:hypothetical protein
VKPKHQLLAQQNKPPTKLMIRSGSLSLLEHTAHIQNNMDSNSEEKPVAEPALCQWGAVWRYKYENQQNVTTHKSDSFRKEDKINFFFHLSRTLHVFIT